MMGSLPGKTLRRSSPYLVLSSGDSFDLSSFALGNYDVELEGAAAVVPSPAECTVRLLLWMPMDSYAVRWIPTGSYGFL